MVSIQVISRTVDADGLVQYQFDDGTGVEFASVTDEESWCVEPDTELLMRPNMVRVAVCKTVHGMPNVTVTVNVDDVNGNIMVVA